MRAVATSSRPAGSAWKSPGSSLLSMTTVGSSSAIYFIAGCENALATHVCAGMARFTRPLDASIATSQIEIIETCKGLAASAAERRLRTCGVKTPGVPKQSQSQVCVSSRIGLSSTFMRHRPWVRRMRTNCLHHRIRLTKARKAHRRYRRFFVQQPRITCSTRNKSSSVSTPAGNGSGLRAAAMRQPASRARSCSRDSICSSVPGGIAAKARRWATR